MSGAIYAEAIHLASANGLRKQVQAALRPLRISEQFLTVQNMKKPEVDAAPEHRKRTWPRRIHSVTRACTISHRCNRNASRPVRRGDLLGQRGRALGMTPESADRWPRKARRNWCRVAYIPPTSHKFLTGQIALACVPHAARTGAANPILET